MVSTHIGLSNVQPLEQPSSWLRPDPYARRPALENDGASTPPVPEQDSPAPEEVDPAPPSLLG